MFLDCLGSCLSTAPPYVYVKIVGFISLQATLPVVPVGRRRAYSAAAVISLSPRVSEMV